MPNSDYNPAVHANLSNGVGFIEGEIVPISEAKIPILDWGFLHSDATYDVVHVWNNRFFRIEDHLDRFMNSMEKLNMAIDFDRGQIREILARCVKASGLKDAYVEMICTRGVPAANSRDPRRCKNRFYAFVVPFSWVATRQDQDRGVRLHISSVQRIAPQSVDPTIKNYHWLDLVRGQYDAYAEGADLAVLSDMHGNVVEGAGFNIFAVTGKTVVTPSKGVLKGITRKTAMELSEQIGLEVHERDVPAAELLSADEVFITSTAGGIMPIKFVNEQLIGNGLAENTVRLRELYWEAHQDPVLSQPV
ncbi:aminotransferase class IV [Alcaligenaceae bacterium CGII-47]|nr:aminotransferase class IV [Alcaligenaceae bacterium CGII-47]